MSRQASSRGMLAIPLHPEMEESLLGYLTRVAERNVLESPAVLLEGIASWPPSQLTLQQQARLARVLGIELRQVEELFDRTYRSGLPANLLTYERRRVSPSMLKQAGCDRALWLVKPLTCCCKSWRELIDACPHCGQALRWGHSYLTRCQSCEADLTSIETREVQRDLRDVLHAATQLAMGCDPVFSSLSLHPDLSRLGGPDIIELAVLCGRALAPKAQRGVKLSSKGVGYEGVAAGLKLLQGYPISFRDIADSAVNTVENPFFRKFAAGALTREGELKGVINVINHMAPEKRGVERLRIVRVAQRQFTATELAAALGIEKSRVRDMADAGVFGPRAPRGVQRKYDWFSKVDIEKGRAFIDSRIFASQWAKRMGLSPMDVCQLVGDGLLGAVSDAAAQRVFASKLQIEKRSQLRFEEEILSHVRFSGCVDQRVPVVQAFKMIGGAYKPWSWLIRSALNGTFLHGLQCHWTKRLNFLNLSIHTSVAVDIARRVMIGFDHSYRTHNDNENAFRPNLLTRREVEIYLNCTPSEVGALIYYRYIDVVSVRPTKVDARSVERFGDRYVSMGELSALYQLSPPDIRKLTSRAGLVRQENGFWWRRDLRGSSGLFASCSPALVIGAWELSGPSNPLGRPVLASSEPENRSSLIFRAPDEWRS